MPEKDKDDILFDNATKAIRSAVRKVRAERKLRGQPLIIWKDGKVVQLRGEQIKNR